MRESGFFRQWDFAASFLKRAPRPANPDGHRETQADAKSTANLATQEEFDGAEAGRPASGARSGADAVKLWADAIFALMKSALLLMVAAVVIFASATAIWRDLHQRLINVNIDPQAQKLLRDQGIYFDLRSMLVDKVNERVFGVDEIVKSVAYENLLPTENSASVSFKPFGLDISTDDITGMVRSVLRSPPEFVVHIGMTCSLSCGEPGTAEPRKLTLLVRLQGPTKNETLSFELIGGSLRLRRGLREAMDKTSEKVLELADPLRASVLYLNEPQSMVFDDQRDNYWGKAAGTTFAPGARAGAGRCLADVVFGVSAFLRGDPSGLDTLRLVGKSPDASATCKIAAMTDIALFELAMSEQAPAALRKRAFRASFAALESLKRIKRRTMSHGEHSRIVAIEIQTELLQTFNDLSGEGSSSLPTGTDGPKATVPSKARRYARLIPLIDGLPARVPDDRDNASIHEVVSLLSELQERIAAGGDLWSRVAVPNAVLRLISPYLHNDSHPRVLFMAQGQALMGMALAELDALSMPHAARMDPSLRSFISSNLQAAAVAFENAAATSSISRLTEPLSDLEPIVMRGDSLYLAGDENGAKAAYAAAAKKFVEEDEPLDIELVSLAKAAARWAAILVEEGACKGPPARDPAWDAAWSPLGAAGDINLCLLTQPAVPTPAELDKFGVLRVLYPLLSESVRQCTQARADATDEDAAAAHRAHLLECLERRGPDSPYSVRRDLALLPGDFVDQQIASALDRGASTDNVQAASR
jgi:hypothetical protein